MARAKRALEDVDPNVPTNSPKSSKANDGRRQSSRLAGTEPETENQTTVTAGVKSLKSPGTQKAKKDQQNPRSRKGVKTSDKKGKEPTPTSKEFDTERAKDKEDDSNSPEWETDESSHTNGISEEKNKSNTEKSSANETKPKTMNERPRYEYIVGQPPHWDWEDQKKTPAAYDKMMKQLKPKLFNPIEDKPDHKWMIMPGTLLEGLDGVSESNKRNPDLLDLNMYNDFEGYGLHEVVENFLVAYRKQYMKKEKDRNLKEMWVILSGLIYYLKQHRSIEDLYGHIDDGDRVVSALSLIGTTFLSLLDVLERADCLKPDSEFKDLSLVMSMYLIWAQQWDAMTYDNTTQRWDVQIFKYAQDHNIDLSKAAPRLAASTVKSIKSRAEKQKAWPKAGVDRWGFKKAIKEHGDDHGCGGHQYDITKMSRAERKSYSYDGKDPLADIPDAVLKSGKFSIDLR